MVVIVVLSHSSPSGSSQSGAQEQNLGPSTPLSPETVLGRYILSDHLSAAGEGLLDSADAGNGGGY
jgi:hypothetical protein